MYEELDNLDLEQLKTEFWLTGPDGADYAATYSGEVALRLVGKGKEGWDYLWQVIDLVDADRLPAAIFGLTVPFWQTPPVVSLDEAERQALCERLVTFLTHSNEYVIMEAVDGLRLVGATHLRDRVILLGQHASPYVRGAVLRFVAGQQPVDAIQRLLEGLQDAHFIVRGCAADALGALGNPAAIRHLRPLLHDPHPHVRQAVETAIGDLEQDR
jgi:HEAT repeat protein